MASRFGSDKAFAGFRGRPMIHRVADVLASRCDELVVSVSTPDSEARVRGVLPHAIVVADVRKDRGPIEGFSRGFAAARGEIVLVAPCDAPLLRPELYDRLLECLGSHEAAVPRPEVFDPLRAVYRRDAVRRVLSRDTETASSPSALVDRLDAVFLEAGALQAADPGLRSFFDVNRPEDLKRASEGAEATAQ